MVKHKPALTDQQAETIIGNLLRISVIIAAIVVLLGGILYLFGSWAKSPEYRFFVGEPRDLRTLHGIIKEALAFDSLGVIQLGLLLLIATPVARVLFAVFVFAVQGDRLYVAVSLTVLIILIYSLTGGGIVWWKLL